MKSSAKSFDVVSIGDLAPIKNAEALKLGYSQKMELLTKLREYFYGEEATTGRVQRVYSVIKLGKG